ncbi:MAG: hypothetical protein HOB51_07220 [Thaumarchaeota archaeon]|jgi:hypothetical protein|nr:hypothetical protein [Nitrososphaerota archaeon]
MSKFLLYLGIILIFSGIGTGVGIFLVIFYFWDDIKKSISNIDVTNKNNCSEKKSNPKYYNEDTAEKMK